MKVTRHFRHCAFFQMLPAIGLTGVRARASFQQLKQYWRRQCGIRLSDLITTIDELRTAGALNTHSGSEGTSFGLTDRGLLLAQSWQGPFGGFHEAAPLASLLEALHTQRKLKQARRRRNTSPSATVITADRRRANG